ncbi:hypothetical protein [Micromonospora sp. WMMD812]|uniref:hypothetical protein n=1 Tax=Micromonospora sp. WMMD812 TaxID=3015152 RepID=UPI00248B2BCB|nr:hypothetical protein [Micromonospora sp. WMMD812]WBB70065.1 hypothetical protein O7603_12165 [Micromonospora sp. WMMD812]
MNVGPARQARPEARSRFSCGPGAELGTVLASFAQLGGRVSHDYVASWEGFALALVGAAAVLAGLVFVAVSINIDRILAIRGLPGRAGESVILFLAVLCECAFVLIPNQPVSALGLELLVAGLLVWAVGVAIAVPGLRGPTRQPASWRLTRLIGVHLATVPAALAGASLLGWLPGGLYWLAGAVLTALVVATGNAWVLLVEVVRDSRYRPAGQAGETRRGSPERGEPA